MRMIPLDPQGTVRQAFRQTRVQPEAEGLERLRAVLGDAHYAAARELAAWVQEPSLASSVLVLAAACLESARRGSSRLPVGTSEEGPLRAILDALGVGAAQRGGVFELLARAPGEGGAGAILGHWDERKPLVTDGRSLALQRLAALEASVGALLRARLEAATLPLERARLEAALADVLARSPELPRGGGSLTPSDEQRRAALAAVSRGLTVVSGGPGTGKTSVVVTFLRLWVRLGRRPEEVALATPTGKAARRLDEAVAAALAAVREPSVEDRLLTQARPAACTLHRLLGYSPATGRFAHHAHNQLPHGLVVVDECSMVDLALMRHLLVAVADGARLVLLGDAEQLPSVDAGAVLRDLLPPEDEAPTGGESPEDSRAGAPSAGEGSVDLRHRAAVRLTKSYRMDEKSPAGRALFLASQAIRRGRRPDAQVATDAADLRFEGVEWLRDDAPSNAAGAGGGDEDGDQDAAAAYALREAFLERWFREQLLPRDGALADRVRRTYRLRAGAFEPGDEARLQALELETQRARILCLTRGASDPNGAGFVNAWTSARLAAELEDRGQLRPLGGAPPRRGAGLRRRDGLEAGLPVMVTRNAYELELFNGDQGLALWVRHDDQREPRLALVFRGPAGFRAVEPSALAGAFEPCFAMTVHKAQGSEHEAVALLLPPPPEAGQGAEAASLLCRELLYTAVTRARRSVVVVASEASLDAAVAHRLERWSALGSADAWLASGGTPTGPAETPRRHPEGG